MKENTIAKTTQNKRVHHRDPQPLLTKTFFKFFLPVGGIICPHKSDNKNMRFLI